MFSYGSRPKTHARLLVSEWHLQIWMCMFCCSGERPRKGGVRFAKDLNTIRNILIGGLEHFFSIYWECHHPNWLSYFSEGRSTNDSIIYIYYYNWGYAPFSQNDFSRIGLGQRLHLSVMTIFGVILESQDQISQYDDNIDKTQIVIPISIWYIEDMYIPIYIDNYIWYTYIYIWLYSITSPISGLLRSFQIVTFFSGSPLEFFQETPPVNVPISETFRDIITSCTRPARWPTKVAGWWEILLWCFCLNVFLF